MSGFGAKRPFFLGSDLRFYGKINRYECDSKARALGEIERKESNLLLFFQVECFCIYSCIGDKLQINKLYGPEQIEFCFI